MSREKWVIIVKMAKAQNNEFKTGDAVNVLKHFYYYNAGHYVQQILKRMCDDGCIVRVKKGHYILVRSSFKTGSRGIKSEPINKNQTNLF